MSNEKIVIYCDGACSDNQKRTNLGGWGAVILRGREVLEIHGGEKNTTNNRMELTACIQALEQVAEADAPITIYADSAYLVNCINQKWYERWRRNGWVTAKKTPVENQDLWKQLLPFIEKKQVVFKKVKGHAGVKYNERADQLANLGVEEARAGKAGQVSSRREETLEADARYTFRQMENGYLLRIMRGASVAETLRDFLVAQQIHSGSISAVGALEQVELGFFDREQKTYLRKQFKDVYELISFSGNISLVDGTPFVHAHVVLGDRDYRAVAGHFFEGTVAVTLEAVITPFDEKIKRSADPDTGLNLLDL